MKIDAPAKINLTLEVTGLRDDGYHALRSVMVPLAFADELTIEPSNRFTFNCSDAALAGDDNLAVRAVRALDPNATVSVTLTKRIPTQAGLGGGSSDAAAILRAGMAGALSASAETDWMRVARSLGSDVPFFLAGTGALVEGTGERVTAVGALPPWHVLVVKPPVAVSTAEAYRLIDERPRPSRPRNTSVSLTVLTALQRGDFATVEALLENDFHDVIAERTPEVARALDALRRAGATRPLLSGSGSAVFALALDERTIGAIAERLDLPSEYARFLTAFASAPLWRGEVA
jgi:4-diphosphocytidyl-2-C-methyl-D-erythritol kinase